MQNYIALLRSTLLALPAVGSVTRGQPRQDARLPCVAITQDGLREERAFDDAPYLTRGVYTLRLFGTDADVLDTLAQSVDAALAPLGFRLDWAADGRAEDVAQKTLRYHITD